MRAARHRHRFFRHDRAFAGLLLVCCLLFAASRPGFPAFSAAPGYHAACGCKPGASCCLLLAKLGKKCCTARHGGDQHAGGHGAHGKPSCSVAPSERQLPATPALRDLTAPKALAAALPERFAAPLLRLPSRPAADFAAASLAGREPPDPPPRFS